MITEQVETEVSPNLGNVSERVLHEKGEKYILPVDNEEHERFVYNLTTLYVWTQSDLGLRLRLQHRVIKDAGGGRTLFPPYDKRKSYFVLDVGVGPGEWRWRCLGHK